jgi:hypothetical protein
MGGSVAGGFPNQRVSGPLYGNLNRPTLVQSSDGRRTMPGGPLIPRLPHNPYAVAERKC